MQRKFIVFPLFRMAMFLPMFLGTELFPNMQVIDIDTNKQEFTKSFMNINDSQYLKIELTVLPETSMAPLLCAKFDSTVLSSFCDFIGFKEQNSKQYIIISPSKQKYTTFKVTVSFQEYRIYHLKFKFSRHSTIPCPFDCSMQGDCVKGNCLCQENFIYADCSIPSRLLRTNVRYPIPLKAEVFSYFHMDLTKHYYSNSTLQLQIDMPTQQFIVLFVAYDGEYSVYPTLKASQQNFSFIGSIRVNILLSTFKQNQKQIVYGLISPSSVQDIMLYLSEDGDSDLNVMPIYLVVIIVLLSTLCICCICIIIIKMVRNKNQGPRVHQQRLFLQALPSNPVISQKQQLLQLVEQIMPITKYVPKLNAVDSENCAICQVDFDSQSNIRILICNSNHEFHSDCIDLWLMKQENCPLCRFELKLPILQLLQAQPKQPLEMSKLGQNLQN